MTRKHNTVTMALNCYRCHLKTQEQLFVNLVFKRLHVMYLLSMKLMKLLARELVLYTVTFMNYPSIMFPIDKLIYFQRYSSSLLLLSLFVSFYSVPSYYQTKPNLALNILSHQANIKSDNLFKESVLLQSKSREK